MKETKKILVVDDDEDFRQSIRYLLESRNYGVVEADSGKQGLRKIKEERPDLIVLDIMMESVDEGYSLNQMVKFQREYDEYKNIPILMVSSIQEDPFSRFGLADGHVDTIVPDHYMTKPLDIPKFLDLVGRLVERG